MLAFSIQAFADLILVLKGKKCHAMLLIKQVCSLCPDHWTLLPSVATSKYFPIETISSLYKLLHQTDPSPKPDHHKVKNIFFNCITERIVKPDRTKENTFLVNAITLQKHQHQNQQFSQRFIPGIVHKMFYAPFPVKCIKRIKHWGKPSRRELSATLTREERGHHSSCSLPSLGCHCFLHITVDRSTHQVLRTSPCQE